MEIISDASVTGQSKKVPLDGALDLSSNTFSLYTKKPRTMTCCFLKMTSLEAMIAATKVSNAKTKGSLVEWPCSMNSQYLISSVEIMIIYIEFTRLLRCTYCSPLFSS